MICFLVWGSVLKERGIGVVGACGRFWAVRRGGVGTGKEERVLREEVWKSG